MENKIHVYIYYNLEYTKEVITDHDYNYNKDEKIIVCELTIIADEKNVREILSHPKTKTNEYGEFIDYDFEYLKSIILSDLINYKEKNEISDEWYYKIISIYNVKCELIKDISKEIINFMEKI